jgi:ATP-dependent helicase/nuclease subunit B
VHACADFHEEAERSAACVLDHIAAGRTPVALVSADRALTRRVRAVLQSRSVQMRDETGWKLSTSQAGAALMALVTACAWSASSDAVLAWLKLAPAFAPAVAALEACLRRDQTRNWRDAPLGESLHRRADLQPVLQQINRVRAQLPGTARFSQWLAALRDALQDSGMWDGLVADSAGLLVLQALCLRDTPGQAPAPDSLADAPWAQTTLNLADFGDWVQASLEGRTFTPPYPDQEELVILPLNQTLGRPFAAVVLVGCDADNLPLAADVSGILTPRQRVDMGLPRREDLEQATRLAWAQIMTQPLTAIFWRKSSGSGEPQLPSPLVQLLLLDGGAGIGTGADHRPCLAFPVRLAAQPQPVAPELPLARLSQGAYEDLRNCPYRFFALRQLGLQARDELEVDLGKRAFGLWLHEVLSRFHQAQGPEQPAALLPPPQRSAQLDALADAVAQEQGLGDAEFLPFRAGWPQLRDAYLKWLEGHEALAHFEQAEATREQPLGPLVLHGRLDRIDRRPSGAALVLDYKTEALKKTQDRVRNPFEDTQMAFYAALLGEEAVEGMYLNLSERGEVTQVAPKDLALSRAALLRGIQDDMARIAAGAALPALGEGAACDYCAARGLCRKDFWAAG